MVEVAQADRDAAEILATMICGCADARQRRGDVNQLLAYREQADAEGYERGQRETVERIVDYLTAISDPGSTFQDRRLAYQLAAAAFAVSIEAGEWKQ